MSAVKDLDTGERAQLGWLFDPLLFSAREEMMTRP